jgi:hypothetical protein
MEKVQNLKKIVIQHHRQKHLEINLISLLNHQFSDIPSYRIPQILTELCGTCN